MQTGASALLTAAAIATLYSLVRFFDLFRSESSQATEPQRIDFAPDGQADLSTIAPLVEPKASFVAEAIVPFSVEEPVHPELVEKASAREPAREVAAPKPVKARKPAKAPKKPKVTEPAESSSAAETELVQKADPIELASDQIVEFPVADDDHHARIEPLFEPEPYFRQKRTVFGRRGRI